jgi:hypothetical protein
VFDFEKDDFLHTQPKIKKLAFKKSTIKSRFCTTGIHPWNLNHVLETLGQWIEEENLTPKQEVA